MLQKYLNRIEVPTPLPEVPLGLLRTIHSSHLTHIPFENLSIHMKEGISLRIEDLVKKLVDERRGGYCFENNLLSFAVLKELGFEVTLRGARVINGEEILPITHLVLEVKIAEESWLYDVGFGGSGILYPQKMNGEEQDQRFYLARVRETEREWILEKRPRDVQQWTPLYSIQKIDFHYIDCVVANHYTSTHPSSIFTKTFTVQKFMQDSRVIYRKTDVLKRTILTTENEETIEVSGAEAFEDIKENFGFNSSFLPKLQALIGE